MAKVDLEKLALAGIEAFKSVINAKISAINAEKADDVVLDPVAANAYDFQEFGQGIPNYNPMVFFNVAASSGETSGAESSETARIVVELVTSDRGLAGSGKLLSLLLRYRRVVREVLLEQWESLPGLRVIDVPDDRFIHGDGLYFAIAVIIEFTIV